MGVPDRARSITTHFTPSFAVRRWLAPSSRLMPIAGRTYLPWRMSYGKTRLTVSAGTASSRLRRWADIDGSPCKFVSCARYPRCHAAGTDFPQDGGFSYPTLKVWPAEPIYAKGPPPTRGPSRLEEGCSS